MVLSVIVPARNEEKLLPSFIKEVVAYLKKTALDYELIIVENGSQDKTLEVIKTFAEKNRRIRAERISVSSYRRGSTKIFENAYGKALIHGLKKARGKYVVIFNVDFWDGRFIDLAKIDLLGYDIVVGSKNLPGAEDRRPLSRRLVSRFFKLFLSFFFGFSGTDTHGIKALRHSETTPIFKKCRTRTGIFDSELMVRAQRADLKILELPVTISEKRPNRFGIERVLKTPQDIWQLFLALQSNVR